MKHLQGVNEWMLEYCTIHQIQSRTIDVAITSAPLARSDKIYTFNAMQKTFDKTMGHMDKCNINHISWNVGMSVLKCRGIMNQISTQQPPHHHIRRNICTLGCICLCKIHPRKSLSYRVSININMPDVIKLHVM